MSSKDPEGHWSAVGQRIRQRTAGKEIAGDDSPYFRYKRSLFVGKLLPRMQVHGHSVLEVGCGPGGNLREISRLNPAKLLGCDISPEMVDLARKNVPSAEIIVVDGETLPFSENEVDLIFTVTVIQHNPDARAQKLIGEICRVARENVYLFEDIAEPGPTPEGGGAYGNFYGRHVPWYERACNDHGFELVESEALATYVSQRVSVLLRRLDHGERVEGAEPSTAHRVLESSLLPVTRNLDKVMRHYKGRLPQGFAPPELTMMAFRRKDKTG